MAKIVNLEGQGGGGGGRMKNRIRRHEYRTCHTTELHTDTDLVVGTWNSQGANWSRTEERHIAKFGCLVEVMREQKIDVMCLTDLHGQVDEAAAVDTRFNTCMLEEFLLIQCGRVGFFLHPAVVKCWDGRAATCWGEQGRVATIDINIDGHKCRIGSVYMPVYSTDGVEGRTTCWKSVCEAERDFNNEGGVVFGGDWNGHIARDAVAGRQALVGESSTGGKQMLALIKSYVRLINVDHKIPAKRRGTWCSNKSGVWYELDYFLTSVKYSGRFSKLRTIAVGESDHAARVLNFRMAGIPKEKKSWKAPVRWQGQIKGFEVEKLKDEEVVKVYEEKMNAAVEGLHTWGEISGAMKGVAAEVLGEKGKPGPGKPPTEMQVKIKETRERTRRLFQEATQARTPEVALIKLKESRLASREHRYWVRMGEKARWEEVCKDLEEADRKNDRCKFWKALRLLGLYGAPVGQQIRFSLEELRSHFAKIGAEVNEVAGEALEKIKERVQLPTEQGLEAIPDEEEISENLRGMKDGAPGPDAITVSMIRKGGDVLRQKIVAVVQHLWATDPDEWEEEIHEADVIALFKKGDRTKLDNYRGICLLQIISRLVARIAAKRLSTYLERVNALPQEQWGFRSYRSAVDALFVMSRLMAESARTTDLDPVVVDFMDIQKAYPNCSRNAMEFSLEAVGIPIKLRNMLGKLDALTKYRCRSIEGVSEAYQYKRGTREGCPAAPVKFNILHHCATANVRLKWEQAEVTGSVVIKTCNEQDTFPERQWQTRVKTEKTITRKTGTTEALELVGYADDTSLVGRASCIDQKRGIAIEGYEELGHKVHPNKWERLAFGTSDNICEAILAHMEETINVEENAKLLGSYLEADGGFTRECAHRTSRAAMVWVKLKKKMLIARLGLKTKGRLFIAAVIASLMYGTEVRGVSEKEIKKLQTFVNKCERFLVYGPCQALKEMKGSATQTDVKVKLGTLTVKLELDNRTIRYLGHLVRMPDERWEKKMLLGVVNGSSGAEKKTKRDLWWERVKRLIEEIREHLEQGEDWWSAAEDPDRWREIRISWLEKRTSAERQDTKAARMQRCSSIANLFWDARVREELWAKGKLPEASGTPLEGRDAIWLQMVILAGGVHPKGWVEGAPAAWKKLGDNEVIKTWLGREGDKARRRINGQKFGSFVNNLTVIPRPELMNRKTSMHKRKHDSSSATPSASAETPPSVDDSVICEKCRIKIKKISVSQHERLYCPFRTTCTTQEAQGSRKNRKVLRPPPPPPKAGLPSTPAQTLSAEELATIGPMPSIHVRWSPVLPQIKCAASSLPASSSSVAPAPREKRASMNPHSQIVPCYGQCSICITCAQCRRRLCNGSCQRCKRCRKCRIWGEKLHAKDETVTATHNVEIQKPEVPKARPKAKAEPKQGPARPEVIPKGTSSKTHSMCPYCNKWLPNFHREGCPSMPFEIWVNATRQRQIAKHGQTEVDSWKTQCQHCGTPFPSGASKRVHLSGCERRRNDANLPLNGFSAVRL